MPPTVKTPMMARTASISIILLPDWGDSRRAARPKNFGAAGEKEKCPMPSCLPRRRYERARGCAPPICTAVAHPNFFGAAGEEADCFPKWRNLLFPAVWDCLIKALCCCKSVIKPAPIRFKFIFSPFLFIIEKGSERRIPVDWEYLKGRFSQICWGGGGQFLVGELILSIHISYLSVNSFIK